jgi:hypothetical protein
METDADIDTKLIADAWRAIAAACPAKRQRLRPRLLIDADQPHGTAYIEQTNPRTKYIAPRRHVECDRCYVAAAAGGADHETPWSGRFNAEQPENVRHLTSDEPVQPRESAHGVYEVEPGVYRVSFNSDWQQMLFGRYVATGGRWPRP